MRSPTQSRGGRDFPLARLEVTSAVSGKPAHDFPQRIICRRVTPDSLFARIEGVIDGRELASDYPFRRVKCN